MNTKHSIDQWLNDIPENRKEAVDNLRQLCKDNLPKSFKECINYNMLSYVVPKSELLSTKMPLSGKIDKPFSLLSEQLAYDHFHLRRSYANEWIEG